MNWKIIWSTFFLATFKFLFSGLPGAKLGGPFWQVTLAAAAGAVFSSSIFYFASEKLIAHQQKRRLLKVAKGIQKPKRNFTWKKKFLVKIKRTFGILGITCLAPLLLSIPIGSIVCAKFYGSNKFTYPLVALWICVNSFLLNLLWYGLL